MLHLQTPLLHSQPLSLQLGCNVFLKLENTQPSGSFKIRGIGNACQKAKSRGCHRILCSSGGNAGMAAAYAGRQLGMPTTIYVPGSTPQVTVQSLQAQGASVEVVGRVWDDANAACLEAAGEPGTAFIHPYDHPDVWAGNASLSHELRNELPGGTPPGCVVAAIGGGGLACGILQGLEECGWGSVPCVAVETEGAASLRAAMDAGRVTTISDITSIAKSMGAKTVCQQMFELTKTRPIISTVLTDAEAVDACLKFSDHHRFLVEPACGAALATVYSGYIQALQKENRLPMDLGSVVIIVCGGNSITLQMLSHWKEQFGL